MTRSSLVCCFLALAVLLTGVAGQVSAAALLSDFSDFSRSGQYVVFDTATFTSNPTDFRIQSAGDFGGMFYNLPSPVDGTGNHLLELQLDVNDGNVASLFNVVLIDGDGTERVYRFDGVTAGADQVLTKNLADFLQDNMPGTTPGLDVADLRVFHLQGTFTNGNPGLAMDLTFDNLALVPEPTSLALLGLATIGGAALIRRRRSAD